jgi:hypothetical protein
VAGNPHSSTMITAPLAGRLKGAAASPLPGFWRRRGTPDRRRGKHCSTIIAQPIR